MTAVPAAVLDVTLTTADADHAIATWERYARAILHAVGWEEEATVTRRYANGASLVITAPLDALYAATEVNEWAWEATAAELDSASIPSVDLAAERLRRAIADERNPALLAMRDAAARLDVAFLWDDDHVSIGMGTGSLTWEARAVPEPDSVDWSSVHDVPVVLVTGSNGKTTTVRLLGAIAREAGKVAGLTSTDGIYIDHELVDAGDWSGPGGGRTVLRERRVEVGILETARGGILRRGLGVDRADAAMVTNVAADHLGEWGADDVGAIADAKLVVRRALSPEGILVLNADDETLVAHASQLDRPITWMSLDPMHILLARGLAEGLSTYTVDNEEFLRRTPKGTDAVLSVNDVPITMNGAARHNVYNALGAVALGTALGFTDAEIAAGLCSFSGSAEENPGRGNFYEFRGVRVLVDFAHNPHGMDALVDMVRRIPAERRLVLIGQAGDRDNESIRAFVRSMWALEPDRVLVKEMRKYLRGRQEGEVPDLIEQELRACGASTEQLERVDTEWQGVRAALAWARPGDFLFLPIHADRNLVLQLMERLKRVDWVPGSPVPVRD
jgi:UDP-N-acetylmuramyl tripeptide synthase